MSSKVKNWYWRIKIFGIGLLAIACQNTNTKKRQSSDLDSAVNGYKYNSVTDTSQKKESDIRSYSDIPKHNNPDQKEVDSIKRVKTENKLINRMRD